MEQLIIGNKENIWRELIQLGFFNAKEILDDPEPLYTAQGTLPSGIHLEDLNTNSGSNEIGFVFTLNRVGNSQNWQIQSVAMAVSVSTDRFPEGVMPFTRTWYSSEGPLPHKERMSWEVNRAAKIEEAKEHFLFNRQTLPALSDDVLTQGTRLDKDLESELKRLGLPYYPQIALTATFRENLAFLKSRENIDPIRFQGLDSMDFFSAVVYPEKKMPLRIEYINASLARVGQTGGDSKKLIEKAYWLIDGPLPTKTQILSDISQKLYLSNGYLEKAGRIASTAAIQNSKPKLRH